MTSLMQAQDNVVHHAANAAAVTIPLLSSFLNAPAIITTSTAILGIVWYAILIGERVFSWVQKFKANHVKH